LEANHAIPFVLPLFHDPEDGVRWHVIGSMSAVGDDSVIEPLIDKLQHDPAPNVRGTAAYSLGHIGSPKAIPALIQALDSDKEWDEQGHSPSSTSATALDNILGSNETRIKLEDGLCKMAPWPPDYEKLKREGWELYEKWKATHGH
jgi:HEAT repeat protein